MTPPTPHPSPLRWRVHWIWLVVALAAGLLIGRVLFSKVPGPPLGSCTRPPPDTTIVARNVTQQECKTACPECIWTQN
jgi:hypothetical protein